MCFAAEEIVALCRMRGLLPHELLGRFTLDELGEAVGFVRAARKWRATEAAADMEQVADGDEFGVGRVLAVLYRLLVMGGG